MTTKTNYTHDQTAELIKLYEAGLTVADIASALGRTERSIVAKLTHEGAYRRDLGKPLRTKKPQQVEKIAKFLSIDLHVLASLEKCTHEALEALVSTLSRISQEAKPPLDTDAHHQNLSSDKSIKRIK